MIFCKFCADAMTQVLSNPNSTRSNKIIKPIHDYIADIVEKNSSYKTKSYRNKELKFTSDIGNKDVDIAILDKDGNVKGVIMFKMVRSSYLKNKNNYYENMKGEASLFIDNNIPVYEIAIIPHVIPKREDGVLTWEKLSPSHFTEMNNWFAHKNSYWNKLAIGYWCIEMDYEKSHAEYSSVITFNNSFNATDIGDGIVKFVKNLEDN